MVFAHFFALSFKFFSGESYPAQKKLSGARRLRGEGHPNLVMILLTPQLRNKVLHSFGH